jgi:outer membrane receptor protein involved in Fe transport
MFKYPKNTTHLVMVLLLTLAAVLPARSQVAAPGSTSSSKTSEDVEDVVQLSPFFVSSDEDEGYSSRQTSLSTRSAKDLLEIPSSVIVINQELLRDLAGPLQNALNFGVAGVNNNQRADEDRTIRGFRSMMTLRNGFTLRSYKKVPTFDVDRVEVIKGPLSMILASSNVGGGVNTITKTPTSKREAELSLGIGDHNTYRAALNTSGPMARKSGIEIDYRLTLGMQQGDSDKATYSVDQKFVGGSLRAKMSNSQILTFDFFHFIDNDYVYWEDFLDMGDTGTFQGRSQSLKVAKIHPNSTRSFSVQNPSDVSWKTDSTYLNVQYLAKVLAGDVRLSYSYATNRDREFLISGVVVQPNNVDLSRRFVDAWVEWEDSNVQFDYRLDLELGPVKLENMIGFDYQKNFGSYYQTLAALPLLDTRSANAGAIRNGDRAYLTSLGKNAWGFVNGGAYADVNYGHNYSAYIQENVKLFNDRLIVIAGYRYQNGGKAFTGFRTTGAPAVVTSGGPKPSYTTYRHGVIYRPTKSISIYAQQAENVFPRSGVLRQPGTDGPTDPGELFKDQQGRVNEIGVKFDLDVTPALALSGSVVLFDQYLTNVRTLITGPITGAPYPTASAKDQVKGAEVDLSLRFKSAAGVSDVIATLYDASGRTADNRLVNNHLESRPSIFAKHTFTGGAFRGMTVGFGWLGEGSKRAGGSYYVTQQATYDLLGRYAFNERLSVQLNVYNLTDERIIQGIAGSGLVQVGEGLRSMLSMNYRF